MKFVSKWYQFFQDLFPFYPESFTVRSFSLVSNPTINPSGSSTRPQSRFCPHVWDGSIVLPIAGAQAPGDQECTNLEAGSMARRSLSTSTLVLVTAMFTFLTPSTRLQAQTRAFTASLSGTVSDPSGRVLPGIPQLLGQQHCRVPNCWRQRDFW